VAAAASAGVCEARPVADRAELIEVRLIGLSLPLREQFVRHNEGLLRELALIHIGEQQDQAGSLPRRLLRIAAELGGTYAPFQAPPEAAMDAAAAAGLVFCDVTYALPVAAVPVVTHIRDVLEEADEYCRAQRHLLTLPASQEVVAYRHWFFAELLRQLAGEPPRPWHEVDTRSGAEIEAEAAAEAASTAPPGGTTAPAPAAAEPVGAAVEAPLVLDPEANAVAAARRYVRHALTHLHAEELEESAELGVSELVTNALLHARTAFSLAVRRTPGGGVRIEVTDSSPLPAQQRHFGMSATTGRGLRLVEAVSHAWGVTPAPDGEPGKTVWFEPRPGEEESGEHDLFAAEEWAADIEALS
jgi:anti-sigma regulatory factor (Ser/Thr protein kinase)